MYYLSDEELDGDKIYQGDIFDEFPCHFLLDTDFLILREDGELYSEDRLPEGWRSEENIVVRASRHRIVLISQSCDIHEEQITDLCLNEQQRYRNPLILYAPLIPVDQLQDFPQFKKQIKSRNVAQTQNLSGAFFFPGHPDGLFPESVAPFTWVCGIRKTRANRFSTFEPRRRLASLRSPYRESLAAKFAHFFGRVALPSDKAFNDNC